MAAATNAPDEFGAAEPARGTETVLEGSAKWASCIQQKYARTRRLLK